MTSSPKREPDHDHVDGCICDVDPSEYAQTDDRDLPAAKGGVVGDRKPRPRPSPPDPDALDPVSSSQGEAR